MFEIYKKNSSIPMSNEEISLKLSLLPEQLQNKIYKYSSNEKKQQRLDGLVLLTEALKKIKPVRGVYGNIDGQDIRSEFPETLFFTCESVKVCMVHIGGYPPKYNPRSKPLIQQNRPQLFISGHSHILKVIYDPTMECLHMNAGAAGKQGWHQMRTLIRFVIDGKDIKDCEIIELGKK